MNCFVRLRCQAKLEAHDRQRLHYCITTFRHSLLGPNADVTANAYSSSQCIASQSYLLGHVPNDNSSGGGQGVIRYPRTRADCTLATEALFLPRCALEVPVAYLKMVIGTRRRQLVDEVATSAALVAADATDGDAPEQQCGSAEQRELRLATLRLRVQQWTELLPWYGKCLRMYTGWMQPVSRPAVTDHRVWAFLLRDWLMQTRQSQASGPPMNMIGPIFRDEATCIAAGCDEATVRQWVVPGALPQLQRQLLSRVAQLLLLLGSPRSAAAAGDGANSPQPRPGLAVLVPMFCSVFLHLRPMSPLPTPDREPPLQQAEQEQERQRQQDTAFVMTVLDVVDNSPELKALYTPPTLSVAATVPRSSSGAQSFERIVDDAFANCCNRGPIFQHTLDELERRDGSAFYFFDTLIGACSSSQASFVTAPQASSMFPCIRLPRDSLDCAALPQPCSGAGAHGWTSD